MLIDIKKKVMEVLKNIIDKVEFDKIFEHMGKLQIQGPETEAEYNDY